MAAVLMAAALPQFLADLARGGWQWGERDCLTAPASWIALVRGFDPAAPLRGSYHDAVECRAVLKRAGGVVALMRGTLTEHGFALTDEPASGDVGLVRVPVYPSGRCRPVGAICVGPRRWAVLTQDRGLVIADLPVLMAWSVAWKL